VRKSRFKEEQIIGILKESEAGVATPELCRKHGMRRRRCTGGREVRRMEVSEAKRLRVLEEENRQLKHAVAELLLDKRALQAVVAKNGEPAVATGGGGGDALGSSGLRATRLRADRDPSPDVSLRARPEDPRLRVRLRELAQSGAGSDIAD